VSLSQNTDSTPGYIAERVCREELLDLAGIMMSTQSQNNVLFLEVRLEICQVTTVRSFSMTTNSCLFAFFALLTFLVIQIPYFPLRLA
jgi:hypothetical protein